METNKLMRNVLLAELFLVLPLVGMLVTDEVDWGLVDFVVAAVLLAGMGLAYSLIFGGKRSVEQVVAGVVLAAAALLIWAELAVGVFGTPFAGS